MCPSRSDLFQKFFPQNSQGKLFPGKEWSPSAGPLISTTTGNPTPLPPSANVTADESLWGGYGSQLFIGSFLDFYWQEDLGYANRFDHVCLYNAGTSLSLQNPQLLNKKIYMNIFFKEPFPFHCSPLHYLVHSQQSYPIQKQKHIQKLEPKRANYTTKYLFHSSNR